MVLTIGLEPTTTCLQNRRTTSCATSAEIIRLYCRGKFVYRKKQTQQHNRMVTENDTLIFYANKTT